VVSIGFILFIADLYCDRYTMTDNSEKNKNQQYEAPSPNDGVTNIGGLKFGMKDYSEEMDLYYIEVSKAIKSGKDRKSVKHWRDKVSSVDPYAMIRICEDPVIALKGIAYRHLPLWEPQLFESMLMQESKILGVVLTVLIANQQHPDISSVTRKLNVFYRNVFSKASLLYFESIINSKEIRSGIIEEAKYCISRTEFSEQLFCDKGSIIVARWLLEMCCTTPEYWTNKAAEITKAVDGINIPDRFSVTGNRFVFSGRSSKFSDSDKGLYSGGFETGIKFKSKKPKIEE
jgi:hypothetical protein